MAATCLVDGGSTNRSRVGVVELARVKYSAQGCVNEVGWHQGIP